MFESGPYSLSPDPSPTPTDKPAWGWKDVLFALLFMIGGSLVVGLVLVLAAAVMDIDPVENASLRSPWIFAIGAAVYLLMLLAVYLFAVRRTSEGWAAVGLRSVSWIWVPGAVLLTVLQLFGIALINAQVLPIFTGADFENPQIDSITGGFRLTANELVLLLLLIGVLGPVAEELFFRGMLYPVMRRRLNTGWAIALNAAVFAMVHFIPLLLPSLIYVGLLLAWVRERSNSVVPGIIIHMLQNTIATFGIYAVSQSQM